MAGRDMSDVTIRRAIEGDAPVLSRLLAALSEEIDTPSPAHDDIAALVRFGFGATPFFRVQVAEREGAVLGLALYFPEFSTYRRRPGVYLQDLYLVPDARELGLGRRLIGAVLRDAADWDVAYLRLAVHLDNPALGFYQRIGFQTDPRERAYWVEGAELHELAEIR